MDFTEVKGLKDYEFIKNEVKSLLKQERYIHSLNVEKEAIKLGKKYGEDEFKCKIAGIAHDCVKNFTNDKLYEMAHEYGVNVDIVQKYSPQLMHGPVGAAYCKDKFEINDKDILNAIYYHTTGRGNMSLLEKIIYIADIIEEGRNFQGVNELRKKAYENIDEAILMSCNFTIEYVLQRRLLIHPLTIELRNTLILGGTNE